MATATDQAKTNSFRQMQSLLTGWGIPQPAAGFAAAAVFHETGDLTSRVSKADHNYSGIKFINKPKVQQATKGTAAPEGGNYARYSSTNLWAKDYARLLKKKPGVPAGAKSIQDFAARLKANGYYTDSVANYTGGLVHFYNKYALKAANADTAHEKAKADYYYEDAEQMKKQAKQGKFDLWEWLKDLPAAGKVGIGVGVAFVIQRLTR